MNNSTRESLLLRIRNGDEVAWEEFYTQYRTLVLWAAARGGLHGTDADEVVQEVMLEIFKGQPRFRYDPARGRFRDYLLVVIRRVIARLRERQTRRPQVVDALPEPEDHDDRDAAWELEWRRFVLREALEQVRTEVEPATFRAFEAYELDGRDVRSVAAELGIAPASVYVYKRRIVRRLRTLVEDWSDR